MIFKGFKTCLLFHLTCLNLSFSWDHYMSIGIQGKRWQKIVKKIIEFDPNLGFQKLSKLVLHI